MTTGGGTTHFRTTVQKTGKNDGMETVFALLKGLMRYSTF